MKYINHIKRFIMYFDARAAEAGGRRGLHTPHFCGIINNLDYLIIWVIGVLRRTVVGA